MTGINKTTEKNLMVFTGRAHPHLADGCPFGRGLGLQPEPSTERAAFGRVEGLRGGEGGDGGA